jgi:hypothetical protein
MKINLKDKLSKLIRSSAKRQQRDLNNDAATLVGFVLSILVLSIYDWRYFHFDDVETWIFIIPVVIAAILVFIFGLLSRFNTRKKNKIF